MNTPITCPRCRTSYQAEVHQIIDIGLQPELKRRMLNGQLNVAVCPKCGAGGEIATPMIYHDPEHQLFMVYVPNELNFNQIQREQLIGRLTREVMDNTPPERRKAYMFQPQQILTMQTFMEKVLETEGITREMVERQRKQAELLQTLATASPDVVDYLIQQRLGELDETFFAILQAYIDTAGQMNDDKQLLPLLNLRARLMTSTPIGRELEKQRVALHGMSLEAKQSGGLSPAILLKHILQNLGDDGIVETLVSAGQGALSYDFFQLLTAEIEKTTEPATVTKLTKLREDLLEMQANLQRQSQELVQAAEEVIQGILAAPDRATAVKENLGAVDEVFMYVLSGKIAQAEQNGRLEEAQALEEIHELIMKQAERSAPPEMVFLNDLLRAETPAQQEQIMSQNPDMLVPELIEAVEMLAQRARSEGQNVLSERLLGLKKVLTPRVRA